MTGPRGVDIPLTPVCWRPCYRIVASRFPPIGLFERVADPADLDAVYMIEALTNDRLRDEVGDLALVPAQDRVAGPGSSAIMAAFTHINAAGDRFGDGTYGLFYAADRVATAVAETRHHRAAFLRATAEPAQELDMRVYAVDLDATLHDVRPLRNTRPEIYDPDRYAASQALARDLRDGGSDGILFYSVRDPDGQCVAVFRPRLLSNCRQERHLCYVWDGQSITTVYEKRAFG